MGKLDTADIEDVCNRIASGESQQSIAESFDVSPALLSGWLSATSERSARAREARLASSEAWMDKALKELDDIPVDGSTAQIARAKELAQHCRKMAAIRNPREYGDKIDVTGKIDHEHSIAGLIASLGPTSLIGASYQTEDAKLIE